MRVSLPAIARLREDGHRHSNERAADGDPHIDANPCGDAHVYLHIDADPCGDAHVYRHTDAVLASLQAMVRLREDLHTHSHRILDRDQNERANAHEHAHKHRY